MLISTENTEDFWAKLLSLPSWERGLKLRQYRIVLTASEVAPLVGAWIETTMLSKPINAVVGRSPRGSVD